MIAFTFPGQGSQRPGMGRAWVDHPSWELVGEASNILDRDLAGLLLEAGAEELRSTANAQLATYLTSLVVLDAAERVGLAATVCAGHSLGEYSALTAAGVVSFEDGVRVVAERGDAMQDAAAQRPGTMTALVGLDDDDADAACRRADGDAWVANYNAPGQVVVAGSKPSVAAAAETARELGARKALPLPVGGAFHTPFMAPARDRLRKAFAAAATRDPDVPVVANVDARPHRSAHDWPGLLSAQLCSPVRWRQSLLRMRHDGVTMFVELGSGGVLTALARRTVPDATAMGVADPGGLDALLAVIADGDPGGEPSGEHLHVCERLVVSPATGVFVPAPPSDASGAEGEYLPVGGLVGRVGEHEVRSPFGGWLMGIMTIQGERVTKGQPVAWLRTS